MFFDIGAIVQSEAIRLDSERKQYEIEASLLGKHNASINRDAARQRRIAALSRSLQEKRKSEESNAVPFGLGFIFGLFF